jgi:hypothetical protein
VIELDDHDTALVALARAALDNAIANAHRPSAVAKRITTLAVRHRNRGRAAAMKRHPFSGVCEASGQSLAFEHAHLDELEPEIGYAGQVRWVCQRANNSGKHSCGACGPFSKTVGKGSPFKHGEQQ